MRAPSLARALAVLMLLAGATAASAGTYPHPLAVGHRGGSALRPENTVPAYDFTLSNGGTGIEVDVWLSSDGFPVLHHDETVDRTTDGTGIIWQKTLAEILSLDAGSWFAPEYAGTPVPQLEDGLDSADGLGIVMLDIKNVDYVATIVTAIENHGFDPDQIWVWNRIGTGPPFDALMPEAHIVGNLNLDIDREWVIYQRTLLGQDAIDAAFPLLDRDYVDLVHSYGLLVMAHTVTSPFYQQQLDIGTDIVVAGSPTLFASLHLPGPDPQCIDGIDNDGDGLTDFPADPGCWANEDNAEHADCSDGLDNDGDGLTDYPADPGCFALFYTTESPQCSDGVDNNGDGDVDYPADAGCFAAFDQGEQAACGNGIDDDGDLLNDYPVDPGCPNVWATIENPECNDKMDNDGDGVFDYPNDTGCDSFSDKSERGYEPACNDAVDNDGDGLIDHPEDPECLGPNDDTEAIECNDGIDNDNDGLTDYPDDPDCLSSLDLTEQTACRDGLDGDGDGLIDLLDPGCRIPDDPSELIDCADGVDNDADGLIDFPEDPDCTSADDPAEHPDCGDGLDNDGDKKKDYPADPDCVSASDTSELPACQDGLDNDGDQDIDAADTGCWGSIDPTEEPDCNDGIDNDGDGFTDYPADPVCASAEGPFEWILSATPALSPAAGAIVAALMAGGAWALRWRPRC